MSSQPITQKELSQEYIKYKVDIDAAVQKVLASGRYILGPELERFEERFAKAVGAKYALGVGSGYDALYLSMSMYPPTYVYIDKMLHVAPRNAAVLAQHTVMEKPNLATIFVPVISPANGDHTFRNGVIIEDACQAFGMKREIPKEVTASCYSFHPLKTLHCYGDGGAIATNHEDVYKDLKRRRNHGRLDYTDNYYIGSNSRLDEVQAAVLNVMMDKLGVG